MNINTGEIRDLSKVPQTERGDWVPIKRLANPKCADCRGKGSRLVKNPGKRGQFHYTPCECTQQKLAPAARSNDAERVESRKPNQIIVGAAPYKPFAFVALMAGLAHNRR